MCRSRAEGGTRCAGHSVTGRARKVLLARLDEEVAAGNTSAAFETTALLGRLEAARARYGNCVTPMSMDLPVEVEGVFAAIRRAGFRPLVVGGSVRDALTDGRAPKDVDVEVYGATIDQAAAVLRRAGFRVDEVGKAFGVLKVGLGQGMDVDVSVPRRDNHVGAGHRGFTVETDTAMTATEAAARRDFTINALGYDPEFGVCVDPYGGRRDLKARRLRATSDAFAEDPLRVLRGFQFAARYDMRLDAYTATTCCDLVGRAGELPVERVRGEWAKFYTKGTHPDRGLAVLAQTGWDATVPGLAGVNTPRLRAQAVTAVQAADRDGLDAAGRARLVAATLARGMNPQDARGFMNTTLEDGDTQRATFRLAQARWDAGVPVTDAAVRRWAGEHADVSVRDWARLEAVTGNASARGRARSVLAAAERLGCADGPQPDLLAGRDIVARFPRLRPGPWTGSLQRAARQAQADGVFTDRAGAEAWLAAQPDPAA